MFKHRKEPYGYGDLVMVLHVSHVDRSGECCRLELGHAFHVFCGGDRQGHDCLIRGQPLPIVDMHLSVGGSSLVTIGTLVPLVIL